MAISIDSTMQELEKIQMLLHPKKNLENNAVYGCDCTGCSNACFESCGDGLGPMS